MNFSKHITSVTDAIISHVNDYKDLYLLA